MMLCLAPTSVFAEGTGDVAINEINFPDENFRNFVSSNYDKSGSGVLSAEKIAGITEIFCSEEEIESLQGIEFFTALKHLECYNNNLTDLNVSNNAALERLWCQENNLTTLDVSRNTALTMLYCWENNLTSLDVSGLSLGDWDFYAEGNIYNIRDAVGTGRTFDLSTLPGNFDVNKASNWNGGTVAGTTLTINDGVYTVTYVYSHIIDEDRRYNAQKFEEQFYNAKGLKNVEEGKTAPMPKFETSVELLNPMAEVQKESEVEEEKPAENSADENAALLAKLLSNPETAALLKALAKTI